MTTTYAVFDMLAYHATESQLEGDKSQLLILFRLGKSWTRIETWTKTKNY